MAISHLSAGPTHLPLPPLSLSSRRPCTPRTIRTRTLPDTNLNPADKKLKWVLRVSPVGQAPSPAKPPVDVDRLVEFLYDDLPHLFDDQGIDRTAYDERVKFRDPITKHDTIAWYLFNIAFLKIIFSPQFYLHWAKQ
ncbi:hypothetical protein CRG98_033374, partial [Punica granatum]